MGQLPFEENKGFRLSSPDVILALGSLKSEVVERLVPFGVRKITEGSYCLRAKVFSHNIECNVGLRFSKINEIDVLSKIEIYRLDSPTSPESLRKSFDDFQKGLEQYFGPSTKARDRQMTITDKRYPKKSVTDTYTDFAWEIDNLVIYHYMLMTFGPEEHLIISLNSEKNVYLFE